MRTGIAHLPLHYGRTPRWLFARMVSLAREITTIIIENYGPNEMLRRLADPFWFQAFGCVLGFDWHSSGVTTTVCGALKEGMKDISADLGFMVAGGKGAASRRTPVEIERAAPLLKVDPTPLVYTSRMVAKVDNNALQDGYQLYHHSFFFTREGAWVVVQQGMDESSCFARRYHWLGEEVHDFVCEPHAGIVSEKKLPTLNLVAQESSQARETIAALAREKPEKMIDEFQKIRSLYLPAHHEIQGEDISIEKLKQNLIKTYERQEKDFASLLALPGVGAKTIRALSLIAEVVHGVKPSFRDPARYSFAHGGKDGHPYPVDRTLYDRSIEILHQAVEQAKVGKREKLSALKRLAHYLPL